MPKAKIPDRWEVYTAIGKVIAGTYFVAFKVPLKEELSRNLTAQDRFTPTDLVERLPELGLVIDLTNTTRYYNPQDLKRHNIMYEKIFCEGHKVPSQEVIMKFFKAVDNFVRSRTEKGKLVGVHCTHGLNRTGYLVCRYMIDKMGFSSEEAIKEFEKARGHKMERAEYLDALLDKSGSYRSFDSEVFPPPAVPPPSRAAVFTSRRGSAISSRQRELPRAGDWNIQDRRFTTRSNYGREEIWGNKSGHREFKNIGMLPNNLGDQSGKYVNEHRHVRGSISREQNMRHTVSDASNRIRDKPCQSRTLDPQNEIYEYSCGASIRGTGKSRKSHIHQSQPRESFEWNNAPRGASLWTDEARNWEGEFRQSESYERDRCSDKRMSSKKWNSEPSHSDVWSRRPRENSKWNSETYLAGKARLQKSQTYVPSYYTTGYLPPYQQDNH